jgi:hypothetical protein
MAAIACNQYTVRFLFNAGGQKSHYHSAKHRAGTTFKKIPGKIKTGSYNRS